MMQGKFERVTGTVKFYASQKGFGFVSRDDGKSDVFFHIRTIREAGIKDEPKEGDRLEFDVVPVEGKGAKAEQIKLIS